MFRIKQIPLYHYMILMFILTGSFVLLDYIGYLYFELFTASGADLFPNKYLGIPLALFQFGILLLFTVQLSRKYSNSEIRMVQITYWLLTWLVLIATYIIFMWLYQFEIVGRSF